MKTKLKLKKEVVATLSNRKEILGGYVTDAAKPTNNDACPSGVEGYCSVFACYTEDVACITPQTQNACPIDPQTKVCTGPGPTAQCTCNCATFDCPSIVVVCQISNACAPSEVCA